MRVGTGRLRLTGGRHTRGVRCLALDAVRKHLFSGDAGGLLTQWDFAADASTKLNYRDAYVIKKATVTCTRNCEIGGVLHV